ncbi:hypothetical protein GCM10010082_16610 [Kushneria pakistanensis]|uniref:Uncharacterized protein n=1 Tax=Kushneria pakistanensis TaxID=1508770 RepID=A0ABQ3FIA3_9GAMM|nr:hypothetical protein [Kushneria pakistanensis]GHC24661.1 hypothetical protein GCM10010082_16610 [Kushneria pakistanensis]
MSTPVSSAQLPSLRWLNTLVIVTLMTVTVAITYLGYYYVGAGNSSQVTWFAPELACEPLDERCFTALGRFGDMHTQWDYQKGQLSVDMVLGGLGASQVRAQLEETGTRRGDADMALTPVAPGHYRGTFDLPVCEGAIHRVRGSLVVTTDRGVLGSWYDLALPCR